MASASAIELPAYLRTAAKYPSSLAPPGHGSNTLPAFSAILAPHLASLSATSPSKSGGNKPKVMEFSSGEGYHISRFAKLYEGVDFWASEADDWSCENLRTISSTATAEDSDATSSEGQEKVSDEVKGGKIQKIVQLDFLVAEQWEDLIASLARSSAGDGGDGKKSGEGDVEQTLDEEAKLSGIWGINFLHMIPFPEGPEAIFSRLSSVLKREGGWAVFYGPFKQDEDAFYSAGDEQFNAMIQSRPAGQAFGLRTIVSLDKIARKYGWHVKEQIAMPKGNWVLVFQSI